MSNFVKGRNYKEVNDMNKRVFKIALMGLILALLANAGAYAGGRKRGWEGKDRHMDKHMDRMSKELGLNDAQRDKVTALKKDFREQQKELFKQISAKKKELGDELGREKLDKKKIDAITAELDKLSGKKLKNRISHVLAVREVLTYEQYSKLHDKTCEREGKRGRKGCFFRGCSRPDKGRGGRPE